MNSSKIYVITHKKYDKIIQDELYTPLLAGAYKYDDDFGYLRDDIGDNISIKNNQYSELTGQYWMWKNTNTDIIGLCHYKRYFSDGLKKEVLKHEQILEYLDDYDIILHKRILGFSNRYCFEKNMGTHDFNKAIDIFLKTYPEYENSLNKVLKSKISYCCCMFITNKKIFNEYCEWLFNYLDKIDNVHFTRDRNVGYIAEMLLTVYVNHNNLKIKDNNLYYSESKYNLIANLIDKSYLLSKVYFTYKYKIIKEWTKNINSDTEIEQ